MLTRVGGCGLHLSKEQNRDAISLVDLPAPLDREYHRRRSVVCAHTESRSLPA
jgi:hypothetical protein